MVVGIVLYVVVMAFTGFEQTVQAAALLSSQGWLSIVALTGLFFLLRLVRWQWYFSQLGHRIPWGRSFVYYMTGFALTATPGKVGENIRSVYYKPLGVGYTHSLAAFFAERFTDLLAVATLAILILAEFQEHTWPVVVAGVLIVVAFIAVRAPQLPRLLDTLQGRVERPGVRAGLENLATTLRASSSLLGWGTLFVSYVFTVLAWFIEGYILYIILASMGLPVDVATAVGIFSLGLLVGVLSFIPGGLGSAEAVMILLLVASGVGNADATAATLLCRVATLWFAVGLGSLALIAAEMERRATARTA